VASGTPSVTSRSGHTLAATIAIRRPEMMARSATGNFVHQLGALSCVVNVDSPGDFRLPP
jgi:hypothetical protein